MNKDVISINSETMLADIQSTEKVCQLLIQSPHYRKLGAEGIYAIVNKAKSIGVSVIDALNGGMYFVQGKVEMTSATMNQMIRQQGHSISKDKKSNDSVCILHGKRADNGDTWVESFSIEDAKRAGIYRNQWLKYPKDMLFARALSRLARQLFPDVIKGCYVHGEILESSSSDVPDFQETEGESIDIITEEQYEELQQCLGENDVLRNNVCAYLKERHSVSSLKEMPSFVYEAVIERVKQHRRSAQEAYGEHLQAVGG